MKYASDQLTLHLADEQATVAVGLALGRAAAGGGIVFLEGVLGAGKTTLCRGILRAFGYQGAVKSPTYTLVEAYALESRRVYHFDLYRLGDPEELEYLGIRDYFLGNHLCLIEWPERGTGFLPAADLRVKVTVAAAARNLQISAHSAAGRAILRRLKQHLSCSNNT
ncbi:MAG: tRNA (adenosine(37)-N6)-threonylcarbamoyltransferase complex ATPase subunit type 1 TsaE [Cellvibrionaceae bacterium]